MIVETTTEVVEVYDCRQDNGQSPTYDLVAVFAHANTNGTFVRLGKISTIFPRRTKTPFAFSKANICNINIGRRFRS